MAHTRCALSIPMHMDNIVIYATIFVAGLFLLKFLFWLARFVLS
jgi:hypothetical protein